jgi:hypothetical protein
VRFDITLPQGMSLEDWRGGPVLSPDGRIVVIPVAHNGKSLLVQRRVDDSAVIPIEGSEGAFGPFFSPSGRSVVDDWGRTESSSYSAREDAPFTRYRCRATERHA